MSLPEIAYGTPRKLPRASSLKGRVAVLDIAFASSSGGASFEGVTKKFIDGLGERLAMWVDHHDHELHARYASDPRFLLTTKAEHGACPELITPELVERAGHVDTVCCHLDFDGICSAAKWLLGGHEPYAGADDDARAVDTRMGEPSTRGELMDRALRAQPRSDAIRGLVLRYLVDGANDPGLFRELTEAAEPLRRMEAESNRLASYYTVEGSLALVDARKRGGAYDKTKLLLLGQERAPISLVVDESAVTAAARFDSGINLLELLGLEGGMPTRVSVSPRQLDRTVEILRRVVI